MPCLYGRFSTWDFNCTFIFFIAHTNAVRLSLNVCGYSLKKMTIMIIFIRLYWLIILWDDTVLKIKFGHCDLNTTTTVLRSAPHFLKRAEKFPDTRWVCMLVPEEMNLRWKHIVNSSMMIPNSRRFLTYIRSLISCMRNFDCSFAAFSWKIARLRGCTSTCMLVNHLDT